MPDVIEILEKDHREVEQMFAELESLQPATGDDVLQRRRELVDRVTRELVRHSVAEEVIVYPKVEDKVGEHDIEHAREEHAEAEETMKRLDGLDPHHPQFEADLTRLMEEIRHHIKEEEETIFARMRATMEAEELSKLGTRVEAFKKVAPTHPHPSVPQQPVVRAAAGSVLALMDRARDVIRDHKI
jgi:hemerythrin superfamily protein